MALVTTDDWLPVLAAKLDKRAPRTMLLRSYCNGNAPLPEMGKNVRASWEAFQKKARVNYGGLAVRALKNRIRPIGLKVGKGAPNEAELLAAAERIYRDNRLDRQINWAILDRLQVSVGYLVAGAADGWAVVTREKPEFFYAETDALQPWKAKAAIKVWRDANENRDYCWVWVNGGRQKYGRASKDDHGVLRKRAVEGWTAIGEPEQYEGDPPVVVLERPDGLGLIEPHTDVIDGINLGKLQRLVTTAMQAFRQRAIRPKEGGSGGLPDKDEDGNDIDWAKALEPAPGALWDFPIPIDIWESQPTDIRPLLEGEKADRRDFAAVTSTPLSVFVPEGENQSAEGAANAKEGHVSLAQDEIDDIKPGAAMALVYALRLEGYETDSSTVVVDFGPPALVSLTERFAAASLAKSSGTMARRTIQRDILGMSPDEIRQDEADLAAEQLSALFTVTPPAANADADV